MIRVRSAGIVLPLFSLRADGDWGIGDFGQLEAMARWLATAGHRRLQLLPLGEMPPGERSPYSAWSAFALDPIYIALPAVEDFVTAGGLAALPVAARARLQTAQAASGVDYDAVRDAKVAALRCAFAQFERTELATQSARARAFAAYRSTHAAWLNDYTLHRAIGAAREQGRWRAWEPRLRDRDPAAVAAARAATAHARAFYAYVQWLAESQLAAARQAAATHGVALDGDLPFMVAGDSADVWQHQALFDLAASLGAPPDAFNPDGQDWQLPPWRWDAMVAEDLRWWSARLGRVGALFDGCRLDHVVGFFRQWVRSAVEPAGFIPDDPVEQERRGRWLLDRARTAAPGLALMAEDLGDIPSYVPPALAAAGLPGYRVLRWESADDRPRDPRTFPMTSVATWGTHDTSSLASWWTNELDDHGRSRFVGAAGYALPADAGAACTPEIHAHLLSALYGAGSNLVLLPLPDAYAGRERINLPGTVSDQNWGYRMPWTTAALQNDTGRALAMRLHALCVESRRL